MSENKLKDCPFCGSDEVGSAWKENPDSQFYAVGCENQTCLVEASATSDVSIEDAMILWNTRANGWRRVEDGLPENIRQVQITILAGDGGRYTTQGCYAHGWRDCWADPFDHDERVIAWRELPEPFEG
jgi:hypothetical protein